MYISCNVQIRINIFISFIISLWWKHPYILLEKNTQCIISSYCTREGLFLLSIATQFPLISITQFLTLWLPPGSSDHWFYSPCSTCPSTPGLSHLRVTFDSFESPSYFIKRLWPQRLRLCSHLSSLSNSTQLCFWGSLVYIGATPPQQPYVSVFVVYVCEEIDSAAYEGKDRVFCFLSTWWSSSLLPGERHFMFWFLVSDLGVGHLSPTARGHTCRCFSLCLLGCRWAMCTCSSVFHLSLYLIPDVSGC